MLSHARGYTLTIAKALAPRAVDCGFESNATYVISGGLGGQGKSIAKWMGSKGAKNLLHLSGSGSTSGTAKNFIAEMSSSGVNVEAPQCDITGF